MNQLSTPLTEHSVHEFVTFYDWSFANPCCITTMFGSEKDQVVMLADRAVENDKLNVVKKRIQITTIFVSSFHSSHFNGIFLPWI